MVTFQNLYKSLHNHSNSLNLYKIPLCQLQLPSNFSYFLSMQCSLLVITTDHLPLLTPHPHHHHHHPHPQKQDFPLPASSWLLEFSSPPPLPLHSYPCQFVCPSCRKVCPSYEVWGYASHHCQLSHRNQHVFFPLPTIEPIISMYKRKKRVQIDINSDSL